VVVELPKTKKAKTGKSEVAEWGRKIERKLEGILQVVKVGTVEQKERDQALNAWLVPMLEEAPPEITQGLSRDIAPILTPAVASWAGSSKVGENYFQGLEVEVEDARVKRLLGTEILAVGSEERSVLKSPSLVTAPISFRYDNSSRFLDTDTVVTSFHYISIPWIGYVILPVLSLCLSLVCSLSCI
jgi:hypothetical protein